jgi:hypothetical protein
MEWPPDLNPEAQSVARLMRQALERREPVPDDASEREAVADEVHSALARQARQDTRRIAEETEVARLLYEAIANLPPGWYGVESGECDACRQPVTSEQPALVCPSGHVLHGRCLAFELVEDGESIEQAQLVGACPLCDATSG